MTNTGLIDGTITDVTLSVNGKRYHADNVKCTFNISNIERDDIFGTHFDIDSIETVHYHDCDELDEDTLTPKNIIDCDDCEFDFLTLGINETVTSDDLYETLADK